jgi:antitoxin (DNA-binding transcriptional repressor) of toxin-antitoxin stability system
MQNVPIADAQVRLPELLEMVAHGEEVVIMSEDRPVAKLTATRARPAMIAMPHIESLPPEAALHPLYPDDDLVAAMMAQ